MKIIRVTCKDVLSVPGLKFSGNKFTAKLSKIYKAWNEFQREYDIDAEFSGELEGEIKDGSFSWVVNTWDEGYNEINIEIDGDTWGKDSFKDENELKKKLSELYKKFKKEFNSTYKYIKNGGN